MISNDMLNSVFERIAKRGIDSQEQHNGDFVNGEGILVCGRCLQPRQAIMSLSSTNARGETIKVPLKVACECKCEKDQRKSEELHEKREKDMELVGKLKELSLMEAKFVDVRFGTLEITKFNERNLKLCKRYATRFDDMAEKCQGLLMWGNIGTGKSFAAAAIANYLIARKVPVIMTSFNKILKEIDSNRSEESAISAKLRRAKLVIFDDLGAERSTDYAIEKVYNIVDERYRMKLPMILTTNLTIGEMKSETDIRYARIYDRIFETCYPMQFTGPSWRKIIASKRYDDMEKFLEGGD